MIVSDEKIQAVTINDKYFDLKSLSEYCSLGVSTLRDHIKSRDLPCFKLGGKVLIKKSEFDEWILKFRENKKDEIENIADEVIKNLH